MEILRSAGWLANLYVLFGRELQESFQPRAGMFGTLPLESVRQQHHNT
jgi:hypothetical protein